MLKSLTLSGQKADSLLLKIDNVESKELLDLYNFEGINYFKLNFIGKDIQNQYFTLTSNEFWNGKSVNLDTIADTKLYGIKNGSDTLGIRVMAKKIKDDTVKFHFNLPGFTVIKPFATTKKDTYSLRDVTLKAGQQFFEKGKPINLLVYSLPYEDPTKPGYLFYCELSKNGIPPEEWGNRFKVAHYVIFKIQLID